VLKTLRKYSDSLVSGVIVIGLVLGSIALSVLLLLQVSATTVCAKGTNGGLSCEIVEW